MNFKMLFLIQNSGYLDVNTSLYLLPYRETFQKTDDIPENVIKPNEPIVCSRANQTGNPAHTLYAYSRYPPVPPGTNAPDF